MISKTQNNKWSFWIPAASKMILSVMWGDLCFYYVRIRASNLWDRTPSQLRRLEHKKQETKTYRRCYQGWAQRKIKENAARYKCTDLWIYTLIYELLYKQWLASPVLLRWHSTKHLLHSASVQLLNWEIIFCPA